MPSERLDVLASAKLYACVLLLPEKILVATISLLFTVPGVAADTVPLVGILVVHEVGVPPSLPICDQPEGMLVPVPIPSKFCV